MFCENCGKEIPENVKFCTGCGTRVIPLEIIDEEDQVISDVTDANEPFGSIETAEELVESENPEVGNETEDQKISKEKKSSVLRVFAHIGAVIISLILLVCVIATIALGLVRNAVSEKTLNSSISNINLTKIKASSVVDIESLKKQGMNVESENLFDLIYDNINQNAMEQPISREKFKSLVESEEIQAFLSETINDNIVALASDERTETDILDDIEDFLYKEKKTLSKKLGYELTDTRIANLKKSIQSQYGSTLEKFEGVKLDSFVNDDIAQIVTVSFSKWLFVSVIILDVFLAMLLYIVLRSLKQGTVYCGVVVSFVGVLYLVLAFAMEAIVGLFLNGTALYLANQFIDIFVIKMIIVSASMIALGVLIPIVVSLIVNFTKRRKA